MKKIHLLIFFLACASLVRAGITTYTFKDINWGSRVGSESCDGKTDGWVCDKAASSYDAGRTYADGSLNSAGVSVKAGTSGAGATSVKEFTNIRRVVVNFSQNSSDGRGVIYVEVVGTQHVDSVVIYKPATSGAGTLNRDSVIAITTPNATGKVKFWVKCTANAININTLSIYAEEGGSNPFTMSTFQLVTDAAQLQDSDQVIIGVKKEGVNYVMGYYDETISKNNIHAIGCRYGEGRTTVAANDYAIYTLRKAQTEGTLVREAWVIQDELRYDGWAYLVAGGGQTKNKLALWDVCYNKETYGNYGYWDITVATDGQATIKNLGNSKGIYLQYNAVNSPTLFSCYPDANSQTAVCIYREVQALGNVDSILAPMANFGELVLSKEPGARVQAKQTITIQANGMKEDIQVSLKHGAPFAVSKAQIDRDGDYLTITFDTDEVGSFRDTLVLTSGTHRTEALVLARVLGEKTIREVVEQEDYTMAHLSPVVVTKKYDTYIYVRDETGSMLIYDNGDGTGKRYGAGLENGDVLTGVTGKYVNYYGVPEIQPTQAWKTGKKEACEPEVVTTLDSADVCRYVRIEKAEIEYGLLTLNGKEIKVVDAFNTGIDEGVPMTLDAIVSYDWNELVLKVVKQHNPTAVENGKATHLNGKRYDLLGREVGDDYCGMVVQDGQVRIQ